MNVAWVRLPIASYAVDSACWLAAVAILLSGRQQTVLSTPRLPDWLLVSAEISTHHASSTWQVAVFPRGIWSPRLFCWWRLSAREVKEQNSLISRAPSVSCATRLMLSICLFLFFIFIREYLPNRWTYLNKRLHGDGKELRIEYGGFEFLNFWGGLGWGPKMSLFARICPEWPSQNAIWRQNGERYQKSKTVLFWPYNCTA